MGLFSNFSKPTISESDLVLKALDKSLAVIEFKTDGTIIRANDNFLAAMGYNLAEIEGNHHSLFVEKDYATSVEYREFWAKLKDGQFFSDEFKRLTKSGEEIWIQATYNPVRNEQGEVIKVVKFASDITAQKLQTADAAGQLSAISKSQAVIEFNMDGTIIHANENFCATVGYSLDEIKGQHHRMFAEPELAASQEYQDFWRNLNLGNFDSGEYKRLGKNGKEIWIQASYNPIMDMNGKPFKVVKYATDITAQKLSSADASGQLKAISKSQAVIEFNMDGTILTANENFCTTLGYTLAEIQGQHHRMFAEAAYAASPEYLAFWQNLNAGQFDAGEYKRLGKGGKEVWIQASYNPIMDMNGKPFKVVKYASDITAQKVAEEKARDTANLSTILTDCQANVMVADNNLDIIFVNKEVQKMLSRRETELQTVLPKFSVANLIGTCVDDFHQDPSHQRGMLKELTSSYKTQLELAGLTFNLIATPWYGTEGQRLGTLVEWEDVTDELARLRAERKLAETNARVKQALDNVATCTMVADEKNNIIYMNEAVHAMLKFAENDLRKDLPNFNADDVMGQNIDIFHKKPEHQRIMLERLSSTYQTEIIVGGRTFSLTANPIVSENNKRLGTVVEWLDRTNEVAIEEEVESIIESASSGDLSQRVVLDNKEGFFKQLSGGLNQIVGIAEGVITDTVEILDALAHGDLTKRITTDYQGLFDKLKRDANTTAEKLT